MRTYIEPETGAANAVGTPAARTTKRAVAAEKCIVVVECVGWDVEERSVVRRV